MSQPDKKMLKDNSGKLVDPEKIDYTYLLYHENKPALLSIAKIAGFDYKESSSYSKDGLVHYLSIEIPKVLSNLTKKLTFNDRLACEIIVSAGGNMPLWELGPRVSIESRKQKQEADSIDEKQSEKNGQNIKIKRAIFDFNSMMDKMQAKMVDEWDYNYDDDGWTQDSALFQYYHDREEETSLLNLFVFCNTFTSYDPKYDTKSMNQVMQPYCIVPKEARPYFKTRSAQVELISLYCDQNFTNEPRALQSSQLLDIILSLLDDISLKPPKPTPKLGLLPKNIFMPIFEKYISKSQAYKKTNDAGYFDWKAFNELITAFMYDTRLIKKTITEKNTERIEVIPNNATKILSSNELLNETFLQWWAQGKNNAAPFLFKSKIFEFDPGMRRLKSDETASRQILCKQIRNEMKPDIWYYSSSLLDKCEIESGAKLFKNDFGINIFGPQGLLFDNDVLREFISTMITFPLGLLGIIEINNSKKELISLGRWSRGKQHQQQLLISTNKPQRQQSDSFSQSKNTNNNSNVSLITVTPNFEVILQTQSPEGRSLAFHLREFCNLQNKSDPTIDPVQIFNLTKESVIRSFRTGNYTWQRIISLLRDASYQSDIPENVKHELMEWGKRYGEIKIRTIEVLDCKDEVITEALLNDPVIRKQITTRVGKTVIEIKSSSKSQILSRCDKLGYLIQP
jgi:hypothetical protein